MAAMKVQGGNNPKPGEDLSAREKALRRLQEKKVLSPDGEPMPRRKFVVSLAMAWAI